MRLQDYTCLAVILIDLVLKKEENYYWQVFSKECEYIKKRMIRQITDDLNISSEDSDKEFNE